LVVVAVDLGLSERQDETGMPLTTDTVIFQAGLMTVRGFIRGAIFDAALPHVYPFFSLRGKLMLKTVL